MYRNPILHTTGNFDPADWAYARSRISQMMRRPQAGLVEHHNFTGPSGNPVSIWRHSNQPYMRLTLGGALTYIFYLVTVAKPHDYLNMGFDERGDSLYKTYYYAIKDGGATIMPISYKRTISYIDGFTQVAQDDPSESSIAASQYYTHDEEIGKVIQGIYAFEIDINAYWGWTEAVLFPTEDPYIENVMAPVRGHLFSQTGPDEKFKTRLIDIFGTLGKYSVGNTRHAYSYGADGKIDATELWLRTKVITAVFDLVENIEHVNTWRNVNEYYIRSYPEPYDEHVTQDILIAADELRTEYGMVYNDYKYYVPLMMVSKDKAIIRAYDLHGEECTGCYDASATETLSIGDTEIDRFDWSVQRRIEGEVVQPEMTEMVRGDADAVVYLSVDMCRDGGNPKCQTWSVTGGGGLPYILDSGTIIVPAGSCGTFQVTADCKKCGTYTWTIRITDHGGWNTGMVYPLLAGEEYGSCSCNQFNGYCDGAWDYSDPAKPVYLCADHNVTCIDWHCVGNCTHGSQYYAGNTECRVWRC